MAKDNYFVIAYKILTYLEARLRESKKADLSVISAQTYGIDVPYWEYIIRHLYKDGYIEGITLFDVMGKTEPAIKFVNLQITPKGIEYLQENSMMHKVKDFLKDMKDIVPGI